MAEAEDAKTLKAAAKEYYEQGFNVVPILLSATDKKPLVQWQKWNTQRQSLEEFGSLPWPNANGLAVVCGTRLNNGLYFGVVDQDVKNLSPETIEKGKAALNRFPTTRMEKTPSGGLHFFYYVNSKPRTISAYHNDFGLELLGEKKLCLTWPSQNYQRLNDNTPTEINNLETIFYEALNVKASTEPKLWFNGELEGKAYEGKDPPCIKEISKGVTEGLRNEAAIRLSCYLVNFQKLDVEKAFDRLKKWNKSNTPNIEETELSNIYNSAIKGKYVFGCSDDLLKKHCDEKTYCPLRKKAEFLPTKNYPAYAFFCDDPGNSEGFKPARVAQWLAQNEQFKTDRKTGILFYGDEIKGKWSQDGETKLAEICAEILGSENRSIHYTNILHSLKGLTYCDIEFSSKLACENGILDPETQEFKQAELGEMTFYSINTAYNLKTECPSWLEFLKQVIAPEDIPTLQEWSGYLLLPDYRFHKLMWLHGEGRNGKGVWQRTMEGIMGPEMVSGVGLEELDGNHRFAVRQLYGKLFNPCSEPTTNRILQTSLLKKATGQDTISAECKGKDKRIDFRNVAKITVIANKFPKVADSTTAFRERRLFIKFPNEFIGKNQIVNLEKAWLDNPEEKSGILSWMLEGLQRLLGQGYFTESKTQEETEIAFERHSDTISAFLKEMVIFDKNLITTRSQAFESYTIYCDTFGLEAENDKRFTQRLKETPKIHMITVRNPKQERAWEGITLRKLNDDGKIVTLVTDVTAFPPSDILVSVSNIGESSGRVTSVTSVTAKDCLNFHLASCVHPNPNCLTPLNDCPTSCRSFKPHSEDLPNFEDKCEPDPRGEGAES